MSGAVFVTERMADVSDVLVRFGLGPREADDGSTRAECPLCERREALEARRDADKRNVSISCTTGCDAAAIVERLALTPLRASATSSATPKPAPAVTSWSLLSTAIQLSAEGIRAPPPARKFVLWTSTGDGVLVRGKVGLFGAKGGTGKSYVLTQLGVASATGGMWFGAGGWQAAPGRTLLLLAEEEAEEALRRLHWAVEAAGLDDELVQRVASNVTILPLAGRGVAITVEDSDAAKAGRLPETPVAEEVRGILRAAVAEGRPYTLAVLDPLSRFAGGDVEKDNNAATRFVQVLETFTAADCGEPSVLVSHHLRKQPKDATDAAVNMSDLFRGASGLVDGVRWAGVLSGMKRSDGAPGLLKLEVPKTNYTKTPPPLMLCRPDDEHGTLRVATPDELEDHNANAQAAAPRRGTPAASTADRARKVLQALHERPDTGSGLSRRLHIGKDPMLKLCSDLAEQGLIARERLASPWFLTDSGRTSLAGSGGSGTGSGTASATGSGGSQPPLGGGTGTGTAAPPDVMAALSHIEPGVA